MGSIRGGVSGMGAAVAGWILAAAVVLFPRSVRAQESGEPPPLRKTDLVRMLTGTTYSKAEVAQIVERACLAFELAPRDVQHLRELGADDAIVAELEECEARADRGDGEAALPERQDTAYLARRTGATPSDTAPGAPAAAGRPEVTAAPLSVRLAADRTSVPVGETIRLTAEAARGEAGAGGVRLVLRGSGELTGRGSDLSAVTGESGRAVFSLRVEAPVGEHVLRASGGEREAAVIVDVLPGPPVRARVEPDPLPPPAATDRPLAVRVRILDEAGNAVTGRTFQLRSGSGRGSVLAVGATDAAGAAELPIPAGPLRRAERIAVTVGDRALALVRVSDARPDADRTRFVSGAEQSGEAGLALPEPLVLEARDEAGRPLARWPVRFAALNGVVRPRVTETDSAGRAAVRVSLAGAGRPTVVTAEVGGLEVRTEFRATGPDPVGARHELLSEAARRLAAGDPRGAATAYARLLAHDPDDVDALVGHGRALAALGDTAAAAARYRAALEVAPGRQDARYWLRGLEAAAAPR